MDVNAPQGLQGLKVIRVRQENQVQKALQDLQARVENLENRALSDLLGRLDNVLVNAQEFWSLKITQLRAMIIILVSTLLVQLLLLYPKIASIVVNLL
jgi:hypothetical protein